MAGNDVLSEGEIDALMDSGAAASRGGHRSFDFTARDQSVLGQFVTLTPILERQADYFLLALEDTFSLEFAVTARPAELQSYGDVAMKLGPTLGVTTLELSPISGLTHIVCEAELLSFLVNQFFGGSRSAPPAAGARAYLTPSEMRIAERLCDLLLDCMVRAWSEKLTLEPAEQVHAMNPDRIASEPERDKVLCLAFDLALGDFSSAVQVLLPFAGLEKHKRSFAATRRGAEDAAANSWEPYFRRELPRVAVELSGVFATRDIALAELLQLQVGAVISLRMPAEVALHVEGQPFATGEYGAHDGKKAIKIRTLIAQATADKKR